MKPTELKSVQPVLRNSSANVCYIHAHTHTLTYTQTINESASVPQGTLHVFSVSPIIITVISWDFSMPFAMHVTRYVANITVCVPCQIEQISNPKILSTGGTRTYHAQIANLTPLCIRLPALEKLFEKKN